MVTEHMGHHGGPAEESSPMLLSLCLILASLILATSIYFSADMLDKTITAKSFSVSAPIQFQPVINITNTPSAAAAPAANPSAGQNAAAGCGTQPSQGQGAAAPATKATVDVTGRAVKGPTTAKVTIVEFSDFQCPYCIRVQPTMAQLAQQYGNQVNFVHFNFIVHPTAKPAHVAVECAGDQGQYWAMHDKIFSTQQTDDASLRTMAQGLGLDMTKYDACIAAGKDATLDAQKAIGSAAGVSGTPSFVIGTKSGNKVTGSFIVGAQDISAFKTAIDAALKN